MDLTNINKGRKQRKPSVDISSMVYGKVPPQAKELEEAVLGAIMLEKNAFELASEILKPEAFYVDSHQRIFRAMMALTKASQPIDIFTVVEELKTREELETVGGPYYVTKLTNSVVSGANVEYHSRKIAGLFEKRELIRIGGELIGAAYEDDKGPMELMESLDKNLNELSAGTGKKTYSSLSDEFVKCIQRIEYLSEQDSDITGITTGFPSIDRITHGWQPTDLIILAARPSMGKTAFALNLAANAARSGTPVLFFSLEMSKGQLVNRILSSESGIWLDKIQTGKMAASEKKTLYETESMLKLPLFIDDTAALNIFELRARARRAFRKHKIGLIIVDYLQLMSGTEKGNNREQEISGISRELKKLAKDLGVPIISLSQLSRKVEERSDKKPQLSDLRESGAIEQDADMVAFLHRPEYYNQNANEMGESTSGLTYVDIKKHRHGALAELALTAKLHIQKFEDGATVQLPSPGGWKPIESSFNKNDF